MRVPLGFGLFPAKDSGGPTRTAAFVRITGAACLLPFDLSCCAAAARKRTAFAAASASMVLRNTRGDQYVFTMALMQHTGVDNTDEKTVTPVLPALLVNCSEIDSEMNEEPLKKIYNQLQAAVNNNERWESVMALIPLGRISDQASRIVALRHVRLR